MHTAQGCTQTKLMSCWGDMIDDTLLPPGWAQRALLGDRVGANEGGLQGFLLLSHLYE